MATPTTEIEFNCPWCNTRLALTRSDFDRERAVLCPRCSNPIDLDIQRRLARTTTPKPQPPIAATRRQVTTPPPQPAARVDPPARVAKPAASTRYSDSPAEPMPGATTTSAPRYSGAPQQQMAAPAQAPASVMPLSTAPGQPQSGLDDKGLSDWSKPLDIDASFRQTPRPGPTAAPSTLREPSAPTSMYGGKIVCASCSYENARVPPEFSFGTVPKCAWCGKPLPP